MGISYFAQRIVESTGPRARGEFWAPGVERRRQVQVACQVRARCDHDIVTGRERQGVLGGGCGGAMRLALTRSDGHAGTIHRAGE